MSRNDDNNPQDDDKIFEQIDINKEFDAKALEEMEREQPSEWRVMKEVSDCIPWMSKRQRYDSSLSYAQKSLTLSSLLH